MKTAEIALIQKAQKGDLEAFGDLVKIYESRVLALAYQVLGNTEDAEDVFQEVFIKLHRKLGKFEFKSDFFTWLYRIVVNTALSYRRKRIRHQHVSFQSDEDRENGWQWVPADDCPDPGEQAINEEFVQVMENGLNTLPLMQRVVFTLRFLQEFKIREIAYITNCSEGTVKNHLHRGTQKMKKILKPYMQMA